MAHEIDHSTGSPAIAYVGETPWHELGERLPEGQPIETWLKAARLDWELKRLPVQYLVDGRLRTMDDRFVLVRSDTQAALSVVSGDYQIVQPKEVLEFYRGLVDSFGYTLETAGALDGGRKVRCHQPQFPRPNSRARPRERRHRRPPGPAQLAIWLRVHLTRQPRGNRNHPTSMSTARLQTVNCSSSSRRSHGNSATPRGTIAESGAL